MNHVSLQSMNALEVLNSNGPMVGYVGRSSPTISLEDENFDIPNASAVIHHALEVHQYELAIRTSARMLCVAMYKCHQAYIAASKEKKSEGWQRFCERNFASLRLSNGNIRTAVRTGEALLNYENKHPDGIEYFDTMSRAALFALGGNEQTLIAVQDVLKSNTAGKVTAEDVRKISEELNIQTIEKLKAQQQLAAVQQTNVELCESLAERKEQSERWKESSKRFEAEAKTPVQAIEYQLPKGVASEIALKNQLTGQISDLKLESDRLATRVTKDGEKLQSLQRSISVTEQSIHVLEDLQADVSMMLAKFPKALAERMASGTPETKELLKAIAADLRTLASTIDVS